MNINSSTALPKQQTQALSQSTGSAGAKKAPKVHSQPMATTALNNPDISAASREKLASYVTHQQQQALLETAKNAFAPAEEESSATMITGEIAQTAAKKQTQQALAFMAIDKLSEKAAQRPHIQTKA